MNSTLSCLRGRVGERRLRRSTFIVQKCKRALRKFGAFSRRERQGRPAYKCEQAVSVLLFGLFGGSLQPLLEQFSCPAEALSAAEKVQRWAHIRANSKCHPRQFKLSLGTRNLSSRKSSTAEYIANRVQIFHLAFRIGLKIAAFRPLVPRVHIHDPR
jgi:hypothetical protein